MENYNKLLITILYIISIIFIAWSLRTLTARSSKSVATVALAIIALLIGIALLVTPTVFRQSEGNVFVSDTLVPNTPSASRN